MAGKLSYRLLAAAMIMSGLFMSLAFGYSGGNGEPNNPYQIASKADLLQLAVTTADYGKCFNMTADIDLAGEVFTIAVIAPDTDNATADFQGTMFSGVFDGNDHTISNLTIGAGATGNDYLGLFGCISEMAIVKRLAVENLAISGTGGSDNCGGIVGWNRGNIQDSHTSGSISGQSFLGGVAGRDNPGNITSCYSSASVTGSGQGVGGLAGGNSTVSTIMESYATGNVSGTINVGGLVGGSGGAVIRCYATGNASGCYVGGLVGASGGVIEDSYATGSVTLTSADRVGGLLGSQSGGSVSRCYSTGRVSGDHNAGGLIGLRDSGTTTASFWDTQTSGMTSSSGGTGKTTALMKTLTTFTSAGWDFVGETVNGTNDYWEMPANSYPILATKVSAPSFAPAGGVYYSEQNVVVTCFMTDAAIHYTINGVDPTQSDPVIASGESVPVSHSMTLKAKAWKSPLEPSNVTTESYELVVMKPTFSPAGGIYGSEQTVTIVCSTAGATIHYTVNGTDPNESDPEIASGESILIDHSLTLKARTWKAGYSASEVESADYVIMPYSYPYGGGSGEPNDPYQIATKADLLILSQRYWDYGYCFVLTADIDLTNETFTTAVIAPDTDTATADFQGTMFSGVFDGNDHTISNLKISAGATGNDCLGLFGCISDTAIVKHLAVENVAITGTGGSGICGGIAGWNKGSVQDSHSSGSVSGEMPTGGLVGRNNAGSITRCYSSANVTGSGSNTGGLVGGHFGTITESYATGSVSGMVNVGGLVGAVSSDGTIVRCYATGSASGYYVGGLVGASSGTIEDSYATGSAALTAADRVGGLLGSQTGGSVSRCYSTGRISGDHNAGGLIGLRESGTVTASFWDTDTSGMTSSSGGTGRTTTQMKTLATFTAADWDFAGETANGTDDYWEMPADWYPILAFGVVSPFFTPDGGVYNSELNVTITCVTTDATIHYTTTGLDPTESDPVIPSGGSVLVDQSLTLKAAAWREGRDRSNVKTATYSLVVKAPVMSPGGGVYDSEPNVVISCETADATIHYTIGYDPNCTPDPTENDPFIPSGGSVLVDSSLTLKAKAWKTGFGPSTVRTETYTMQVLSAAPDSLSITIPVGRTLTDMLTIGNSGYVDLPFTVETSLRRQTSSGTHSDSQQAATETDDGTAAPVIFCDTAASFAPDEILVRFRPVGKARENIGNLTARNTLSKQLGDVTIKRDLSLVPGLKSIKLRKGMTVEDALSRLKGNKDILYAQPNYELRALAIPDDAKFSKLWGMNNTGQTDGVPDADIDAPEAWDIATGSDNEVVVAVIDTGIDYTHPDLAGNMWINTAETPGNGVDDDGNGYIDDIYGCNTITGSGNPMDDHYHGTHCAGTIGGIGNNGIGVAGVCWKVKLMAVKFLNSGGSGWTDDAIEAVNYTVRMKARLSSNSWGGGGYDQALKDAIDAAGAADMLFVAAAGNDSMNTDVWANYPSCYDSPSLISVMATDSTDARSYFSNYGLTTVDLGAPGSSIYSCAPGNSYQYLSGTSMATPHVAGACALIWSMNPLLTNAEVKDIILASVDPTLSGKCVSGGRLNLYTAATLVPGGGRMVTMTVTPDAGTIYALSSQDFLVAIDAGSRPGTYEGEVKVVTIDPYHPLELVIPVTVVVEPNDYVTECFDAHAVDLSHRTLTMRPIGAKQYRVCSTPAAAFPFEPNESYRIGLGNDSYHGVDLGGATVSFLGQSYGTVYVGSNGYITFGSGDSSHEASLENHFGMPRVSALFDDLDPSTSGDVYAQQLADRIVATYLDVPESGQSNANSFQVEVLYNGVIRITYLDVSSVNTIVGLSDGNGQPEYFEESDLSGYGMCNFSGDIDGNMETNLADYAIWADCFAMCEPSSFFSHAQCPMADLDDDEDVDFADLAILVEGWLH